MFFGGGPLEMVSINPETEGYFAAGGAADWLETVIEEQNTE